MLKIDNIIHKYRENILFIDESGREFLYKDLWSFIDFFDRNIKKKSLVFILCKNRIDIISSYLSILATSHVALLLDEDIDETLLNNLIDKYKPNFIVSDFESKHNFYSLEKKHFNSLTFFQLSDEVYNLDDDLKILLTTSGSTGSPKLVKLSYRNIFSNAASISQYLEIDELHRPITTLPMSYSYGLSVINSHFISGSTILVCFSSILSTDFWSLFQSKMATSLAGVPFTYKMLKRFGFLDKHYPSLKYMTQAGGRLADELMKEFSMYCSDNGINFYIMYGQTEATARMSYLPPKALLDKIGSIGKPIPGGKFKLFNELNEEISEPFHQGSLVYEGENVFLGYSNGLNDLFKRSDNNFVLDTGDIAYKDDEDFYYIVGRKNRFCKVFGNRVNLDEIEQLLFKKYSDIAVVGVEDCIYIFSSHECLGIKSYISSITNLSPTAFKFKLIDELPNNSSNKTNYKALMEML